MYVGGINFRRIARHLGVHHQSVINWVNAYAEKLPEAPVPEELEVVEVDEHTLERVFVAIAWASRCAG